MTKKPRVGIIMGSESDMPIMQKAADLLAEFKIDYEVTVASAHRTPAKVAAYAKSAESKYDAVIAGAGMAAALPGVIAAHTPLPVIGVPIAAKHLKGQDALFSIVQMPPGVPVATVAIDGAKNAGILAVQILSLKYPAIRAAFKRYKSKLGK